MQTKLLVSIRLWLRFYVDFCARSFFVLFIEQPVWIVYVCLIGDEVKKWEEKNTHKTNKQIPIFANARPTCIDMSNVRRIWNLYNGFIDISGSIINDMYISN